MSPTQLSMRWLAERYPAAVLIGCEYRHPHAPRRVDFCGGDIVVLDPPNLPLLVQTTTEDNRLARQRKMQANHHTVKWLQSGCGVMAHGWHKPKGTNKWKVEVWVLVELKTGMTHWMPA